MMVRESIAVLIIGVLLFLTFMRSKHLGYALGTAPVGIIPVMHLIIRGILALSGYRFFGIRAAIVVAFTDVLGIAVSCAFVAIFSRKIESKRNRHLYLVIMLIYIILLGWAYLYNTMKVLFV